MEGKSYRRGVRFGRLLTLVDLSYYSMTTDNGVVIMDGTGFPVKVFAGKNFHEKATYWLERRLQQMNIDYRCNISKMKTDNIVLSERMLYEEVERQKQREERKQC